MIVKKLTVPFVNEHILKNSTKCWLASATISEAGFNFVNDRLPKACERKLLTGLHLPTPPKLLRQILEQDKALIEMKIFSENFFHPKVYIFDTQTESYGFIGSGNFTIGGFSKNEELAYMIQDAKQVQDLKDWFEGYFTKSKPLSKEIIEAYEKVYPSLKEKEKEVRREVQKISDIITGKFNWDNFDLSRQYFVRSDYQTFESTKAGLTTPEVGEERLHVHRKLMRLHDDIKDELHRLWDLHEHPSSMNIASGFYPFYQPEHKVRGMWLGYGRSKGELLRYKRGNTNPKPMDFIRLQFIIREFECGTWLMPGKNGGSEEDREYFRGEMKKLPYRQRFFQLIKTLPDEYWIEVAEETKFVTEFKDVDSLWGFTKNDDWVNYYFIIGRHFSPDDPSINSGAIIGTILREFGQLYPLYLHMKDKSFE
jgi:hypothetical protein